MVRTKVNTKTSYERRGNKNEKRNVDKKVVPQPPDWLKLQQVKQMELVNKSKQETTVNKIKTKLSEVRELLEDHTKEVEEMKKKEVKGHMEWLHTQLVQLSKTESYEKVANYYEMYHGDDHLHIALSSPDGILISSCSDRMPNHFSSHEKNV